MKYHSRALNLRPVLLVATLGVRGFSCAITWSTCVTVVPRGKLISRCASRVTRVPRTDEQNHLVPRVAHSCVCLMYNLEKHFSTDAYIVFLVVMFGHGA